MAGLRNNDWTGRGIVQSPRRAPWLVAIDLYRAGGSFRGFIEFALIGALVLWSLPGGSGFNFGSLTSLFRPTLSSAPQESTPVPADPNLPQISKPTMPLVPRIRDLRIEPSYFDNVAEPLRGQLVAALEAYYARDSNSALSVIADADPDDRRVLLMRGLIKLSISGAPSIEYGLALLERAIAKGEPRAMAVLGVLRVSGVPGIPRDNPAGRALLERAVMAGDVAAPRVVGQGFLNGSMGVVDPVRAEKYLRLASDRGDTKATFELGSMLYTGFGLAENAQEAERLISKAAHQGYPEAQAMLGTLRLIPFGAGLTDNPEEALDWLERAAAQSEPHGMYYLAMFYVEYGKRVGRLDPARGVDMLRRCVEQTLYPECVFAYGTALDFGIGTNRDPVKAYAMYSIASAGEHTQKAQARRDAVGKTLTPEQMTQANLFAIETTRGAARISPNANGRLDLKPMTERSADVPAFNEMRTGIGSQ
jgi:TPR repeat protein